MAAEYKNDFTLAQQKNDLLIGVDRGSLLLEEMGLIPDLAIGDFDSLEKANWPRLIAVSLIFVIRAQ